MTTPRASTRASRISNWGLSEVGMGIEGRLVEVAELAPAERERMLELMRGHYENVERRTFEGDLDEKDWVIVLSDAATGDLCGFSTQVLLEETLGQRQVRVLFSGDTIVARQYWGDNALARVWGRLALRLADASAAADLYWFLICKGYKTYRFLPVFWRELTTRGFNGVRKEGRSRTCLPREPAPCRAASPPPRSAGPS